MFNYLKYLLVMVITFVITVYVGLYIVVPYLLFNGRWGIGI